MAEHKEYITSELENGTVNINEEVISTIASTAVKDIDGVVGLQGAGLLGRKNDNKGIRIILGEDSVEIECALVVLYGHSVVDVARNVQTGITNAVESMTGLHVKNVNVNVSGISMSKG